MFDKNGLGDSFSRFVNKPWVDPETGREHPPLVFDDEFSYLKDAKPILRGIVANPGINQQMATDMIVALEQKLIELPVNSRDAVSESPGEGDEEYVELDIANKRVLSMIEQAIYIEADALQIEMGNIVAKANQNGTYTYNTARPSQKKDRYSSLVMANSYVSEIENKNVRRRHVEGSDSVVGVAVSFW